MSNEQFYQLRMAIGSLCQVFVSVHRGHFESALGYRKQFRRFARELVG